jgi:hypothetical protein
MPMRFVHIINPYDPGSSEKSQRILEFTFNSLKNAVRQSDENVSVKLVTSQFASDRPFIPEGFTITSDLTRSLSDVAGFPVKKRLPLMSDVLDKLQQFPDADFYIYSNMDIAPVPGFYNSVAEILKARRSDALIINRRRVSENLWNEKPEIIFAEPGLPHPGYDCFVFSREILAKLEFGNATPGVPGIGFLFAHNLFLAAASCVVLADVRLTYHVGLEVVKEWADKNVVEFQRNEILKFLRKHKNEFRIQNFPGYNLPFFTRHFRWLMNPLFLYPMMLRLDMKSCFDGRKIIHPEKEEAALLKWKSNQLRS